MAQNLRSFRCRAAHRAIGMSGFEARAWFDAAFVHASASDTRETAIALWKSDTKFREKFTIAPKATVSAEMTVPAFWGRVCSQKAHLRHTHRQKALKQ